jgi:hypothetical protein
MKLVQGDEDNAVIPGGLESFKRDDDLRNEHDNNNNNNNNSSSICKLLYIHDSGPLSDPYFIISMDMDGLTHARVCVRYSKADLGLNHSSFFSSTSTRSSSDQNASSCMDMDTYLTRSCSDDMTLRSRGVSTRLDFLFIESVVPLQCMEAFRDALRFLREWGSSRGVLGVSKSQEVKGIDDGGVDVGYPNFFVLSVLLARLFEREVVNQLSMVSTESLVTLFFGVYANHSWETEAVFWDHDQEMENEEREDVALGPSAEEVGGLGGFAGGDAIVITGPTNGHVNLCKGSSLAVREVWVKELKRAAQEFGSDYEGICQASDFLER